jgi:two-component system, NtrC family, response regulator AtoC
MADEVRDQAPTIQTTPAFARSAATRRLLVFGDGTFASFPLPETGHVTIGRADNADVRINHPSVSRRHAVLHIGPPLRIEDLGSANGTRVRDVPLAPGEGAEILPGDVIDLGSTMLAVQTGSASARPRRLWTHSYFEGRLEEECGRAERSGKSFAVVRIHVDGCPAGAVEEALDGELGPTDLVAAYGPNEYETLLFDSVPERADEALRRVSERIRERGASIRVGIAWYPRDGRGPEALVAHACASVRGTQPLEGAATPIVVHDGAMQRLHRLVERIASGMISVLLLGETGAGKEVLAAEIHRRSPRHDKPFVRINCAALAESLLESELFGHERGAFTGAVQTKVGLLESAQGGTVFLDEVGELPPSTQVKLLRVIEEREILRVGSVKPRPIDVRFISATNRDLEAEVRRGAFREDLYFRLNGVSLIVPPLRERVSEIERLAKTFVGEACAQAGRPDTPAIAEDALGLLKRYSWPGNIRELRNVVERAVLLCADGPITSEHLPVDKLGATLLSGANRWGVAPIGAGIMQPRSASLSLPPLSDASPPTLRPPFGAPLLGTADDPDGPTVPLRAAVEALERQRILEALQQCGGNQSRAAKLLGMPRRTLVSRLAQYGIPRPRGPRSKKS